MANPKTRKAKDFISRANQKVVIEQNSTSTDSYGGQVPSWSTLITVWAIVDPISASEVLRYEHLEAKARFKVTIRYNSNMYPHPTGVLRRVKIGSRYLDIVEVKNVGELNELLELVCVEGGAND